MIDDKHTNQRIDEEGFPLEGNAVIRMSSEGPRCWFKCPKDRLYCGVPIIPSPPNRKGYVWTGDDNNEFPTLTPSINCVKAPEGVGCGWHGFIQNGKTIGV